MDELDKILLQHLPDTGLCERSKLKQAQRRRNLKLAFLGYMMNQARNTNAVVTKEGGVVAIDEMQFDKQEMEDQKAANKAAQQAWKRSREMRREKYGSDFCEDKTTVRSEGVVMAQFKDECDPFKPKFPSGGTVANPFDKRKNMPPSITEEEMRKINAFLKS